MSSIFRQIKRNFKYINITFVFLLSIAIVVYLFPKERKFRYEFQKGAPWMHESLFAPYTFPVHKTDEEKKAEEDSIRARFNSYYKYDSIVGDIQVKLFVEQFDTRWESLILKYDTLSISNKFVEKLKNDKYNKKIKKRYRDKIKLLLQFVYVSGIIEYYDNSDDEIIVILKDNVAEEHYFSEIFTLKSAYELIINDLNLISSHSDEEADDELSFVKELNLNEFILPNVFYDKETSNKVLNSLIDNISSTRGAIQKGESIILRGEVINDDKLRILNSLKMEYETSFGNKYNRYLILFGQIIFSFINYLLLFLFLFHFRKDILESFTKVAFILLMIIMFVAVAHFLSQSTIANAVSLYILPLAIIPIIIRIFYDTRLALFVNIVAILIIGYQAPNSFEFVFLHINAGVIAIISLRTLRKRAQIFITAIFTFLIYSIVYFGFAIIQEGDFSQIVWFNFVWFALNALLLIFAYPLIYAFERMFGFLSDVTLIELSDTNNSLLRKLAEQAPGTFQHSVQVSNLAEEAVFSIGGNALLVRAGAMYHDIGKLVTPQFFTENQISGLNPHDHIDFEKSASIIINHVKKGVELAHKYKLPEPIIEFIKTHHGKSKVEFFLRSYKNKYPDQEIEIDKFTYPFPKPYTKETAVMMMADSVEAASRSLKSVSEESISELVDKIIDYQISEKQLSEANITFKEIEIVKQVFKKKLVNIFHARIEYPKN